MANMRKLRKGERVVQRLRGHGDPLCRCGHLYTAHTDGGPEGKNNCRYCWCRCPVARVRHFTHVSV